MWAAFGDALERENKKTAEFNEAEEKKAVWHIHWKSKSTETRGCYDDFTTFRVAKTLAEDMNKKHSDYDHWVQHCRSDRKYKS
jgi:hypothetical protein